ncbi:MAG: hypothetical protein CSA34_06515 [Desulfobulbus propionicus]|nr:MAG: hypothetical protein CSA34_06515 [Desulfobulbus propionicus]
MPEITTVLDHLDKQLDTSLERLFTLLRLPSVSADPAYHQGCLDTADWLARDLQSMGFSASVRETPGKPMVVGHQPGPRPDSFHVLFYGHYDVQPVDPLELWDNDPFAPAVNVMDGGCKVITGRGSSDDKGQLMTFLEACRAWHDVGGGLPIRVSVFLEGEEESGSPSMHSFLEANRQELQADLALVCDTCMWNAQTPAISTSLRGLVAETVVVYGPDRDLHSGHYGGVSVNPLRVLSGILAQLHDANGRVTLDGFYEGVQEVPAEIRQSWEALEREAAEQFRDVGLTRSVGETGRTLLEQIWSRPTAEINGMSGGYSGEGFKTVIPAVATAKVSFRLVGGQDPHQVREAFRAHVRAALPTDCRVEFHGHGGAPAVEMDWDSPFVEMTRRALSEEWPEPTVLVGMGGSIPVVGDFKRMLGMDSLLVGFGLDDDRIHSPNEKYALTSFHHGQRSWARILDLLAREASRR